MSRLQKLIFHDRICNILCKLFPDDPLWSHRDDGAYAMYLNHGHIYLHTAYILRYFDAHLTIDGILCLRPCYEYVIPTYGTALSAKYLQRINATSKMVVPSDTIVRILSERVALEDWLKVTVLTEWFQLFKFILQDTLTLLHL